MVQTLEKQDVQISPEPLYQLAMGFAGTKVLLVAHRLGLFQALGAVSQTALQVAERRGLPLRTTEMLLNACVALKLCLKAGEFYSNSPLAERFLVPERSGYLGRFFDHFDDHMYPAWLHLEEAIRTGHAQIDRIIGEKEDHFFKALDHQKEDLETFMQTMEEHSLLEGKALAQAYDFSDHRELLDIGGGTGAMTASILEAYPHLQATLFDRPPVCDIAERNLRSHGVSERVRLQAGDFFQDPLPPAANVALLSGILHNWSPENVRRILRQTACALASGGILLVSEQVLNENKTGPVPAVLCSLNMLVMMEGAQEYSRQEFESFLNETGFQLREVRPTGGVRQLLVARRI